MLVRGGTYVLNEPLRFGPQDSGTREQATRAAGIINGCGAAGPVVQELLNGRLRTYGDDVIFLILVVLMVFA